MEFTREQQAAVDSRDGNFLIAAGAGAGKTAVLTERVVKLLEERFCDVDGLLIVTFTNAAAQEMRSRIQAALMKRLETELDSDNQIYLERQIILLSSAQISTFDSFCQSILRRNFARIDLDPKFRTGNTNELDILKREVIADLFEENYAGGSDDFKNFTDAFGGNVQGDDKIHEMILDLHDFSLSMPYPDKWLDSLAEPYDLPENAVLEDTPWFKFLKPYIDATLEKIFDDCAEAQQLADANKIAVKVLADDAAQLATLKIFRDDWNALYEKIWAVKFGICRVGKGAPDIQEKIKALRGGYKARLENLRKNYFLADENKLLDDIRELAAPIRELVRVTKAFAKKFSAAKRERNIIDFNDMEHLALDILDAAPDVAENYRRKFKFVMVDEYQDTNGVQEAIIQKISGGENLFLVGDVKQSIYRFRLVDSANFKDKMTNDAYRCINLSKNFRSRAQILTAVNEIFKRLMNLRATEIDYDTAAALQCGADYEVGEKFFDELPEFYYIKKDRDINDSADIELEMRFIAGKIHELLAAGKLIRDGENYRPLEFRDIVILHRSPKTQAFEILDTLKKFGIPAYVPDEEKYFRANEIQIMTGLLNLLDNARQDIPLAAVMLSPIGGFSAEELADLRIATPDTDFYTAVERGGDKCKNFLGKLNHWRDIARQLSVPELLSSLYRETGYYDSIGVEDRGEARQANLRILIDRAADFEATNTHGLSRFIEYLQKIRDLNGDMKTAATLGENDNVVRVVTIHGSKGLEYPVVFVAGVGKVFNSDDYSRAKIFRHREMGVGVYRTLANSQSKVKTLATAAVSRKVREESLAEELRTLYVALTRAQEKLFLVGITSKTALEKLRPVDVPDDYEILSAGKFMDWLLPIKDALAPVMPSRLVEVSEVLQIQERTLAAAQKKILSTPEKLPPIPVANIPAKLSVTELKRRAEADDLPQLEDFSPREKFIYRRPNFMQTKKLSGAEFGTLMHRVMQNLNLSGDLSARGIIAQVEDLARREIISAEHVKLVKADKIATFFASAVGQRLLAAQEYYRELPFSRLIDAQKFFHVDEKIFIQGIIDLLFKDAAGKWILLDYKTDRDAEDISERYRVQIELYTQAVEALLKISVAEKYLYLLNGGRLVRM